MRSATYRRRIETLSKNLRGKTVGGYPVDNSQAYEVWQAGSWTWNVLKHNQATEAEEKNPFAIVCCNVVTPMCPDGEIGDTYLYEIMNSARLIAFREITTLPTGAVVIAKQQTLVGLAPDGGLGDKFNVSALHAKLQAALG
jgi:hypothetical protein